MKNLLISFCAALMLSFCIVGASAQTINNETAYVYTEEQLRDSISKCGNIIVMEDIYLSRELNINKSVNIDLTGHSLTNKANHFFCNIGRSRKVYAVYNKVEKIDHYDTHTRTYAKNMPNGDVVYYTNSYQVPVMKTFYEFSHYTDFNCGIGDKVKAEYHHTEYDDNIEVGIANGSIINEGGSRYKDGNSAIHVISGKVSLFSLTVSGGNGSNGRKGTNAKRGVFVNTKAEDGKQGGNGGYSVKIDRGFVYAQNCRFLGGNGGNGGNGGDSNISKRHRILSRTLNGKGGKGGNGANAISGKVIDQGGCSFINGVDGPKGLDGVDCCHK